MRRDLGVAALAVAIVLAAALLLSGADAPASAQYVPCNPAVQLCT